LIPMPPQKKLIEQAYQEGERLGLAVWNQDEAGPYQTIPQPGSSWRPQGEPVRQPHEYLRNGTAKLLTLFHPATGVVHMEGVTTCPNTVLHGWLQEELAIILAELPAPPTTLDPEANRACWTHWQEGLLLHPTLPDDLPPLRSLLILDNLAGHKTPSFVSWLFAQGIMPLYTPLGGSWLNMAESIQRIVVGRALNGQHPTTPQDIILWLEATARAWNREPTPFEWNGKRAARRKRAFARRHRLRGSAACTRRPIRRRKTTLEQWQDAQQVTH